MAKDNNGNQTVKTNPDPTRNVLDLVEASIKRLDDLRNVENKRVEEQIASEKAQVVAIAIEIKFQAPATTTTPSGDFNFI